MINHTHPFAIHLHVNLNDDDDDDDDREMVVDNTNNNPTDLPTTCCECNTGWHVVVALVTGMPPPSSKS